MVGPQETSVEKIRSRQENRGKRRSICEALLFMYPSVRNIEETSGPA
jgi:hypothetical protein